MNLILAQRRRAAGQRRPPCSPMDRASAASAQAGNQAAGGAAESGGIEPRLLATALTIRRVEERLLDLFSQGELSGTVHACIGQEWVGVAVAHALRPGDVVFSNHRGHGHYLAWTDDVEGLVAEVMGRATGVCEGRGGSQHLACDGFLSSGVQGGIVPVAAGLALAKRLENRGDIAVVFIGDGTLGQGVLYETLNIAAKWSLPLLVVLEDNGVAQSTDQAEALAGTMAGRGHAFGIPVRQADTWHPQALIAEAAAAVRHVRQSARPVLLHVKTYRLRAHSKGDDPRDPAEVAAFAERDTLTRMITAAEPAVCHLLADIDGRVNRAVELASAAPCASVDLAREACEEAGEHALRWSPLSFDARRVVDAIRDALGEAMQEDERIVLLGEDLRDPYGGAFKVTAGLSGRFGDRVRNTPISEAAIVGIGNGLGLAGWRPVVEIMFGDFLMLAADQIINHAAKFTWMSNGRVHVPIVIRTPMGGYRGYGPSHSQSLEKHVLGLPGTRVLALHRRYCPHRLYRTLLAHNDRPTLVIENKRLYTQRTDPTPPAGCDIVATDAPFPTIRIAPPGASDLTIVAYGDVVALAESAMTVLREEEEIECELLIPTQLYPLDVAPIADSVRRTGRVLTVEEGQGFAGFGGEVLAQLATFGGRCPFIAGRVHAEACPIPASRPAELAALPDVSRIVKTAIELIVQTEKGVRMNFPAEGIRVQDDSLEPGNSS